MANTTTTTSHVSWQTAWFILVAVASNSIMQSNLSTSLPRNLNYYARSSPLICASTALALLIRFSVYMAKGNPIHVSAHEALRCHLKPPDSSDSSYIVALERMNGIRLVLFIFAALLPTVKLMGMSGLQGTQAYVGMFVGSYVVVEFMVLLASRVLRSADDAAESLSAQQGSSGEHLPANLQSFLYKVDLFCFSLAFLSHLGLLANALSQVLSISFPTRILKSSYS